MAHFLSDRQQWLDQVTEDIVDPDLAIIDPHHHLWRDRPGIPNSAYLVEQLHQDTGAGHNIEKTVFIECGAEYRVEGPEKYQPLGETAFVSDQAKHSEQRGGAIIAGIVGRADLRLGDAVADVLNQHIEIGDGRFKGIRHAGACAEYPEALTIPGNAPKGLFKDAGFRQGMKVLGRMDMTYDSWHYHYQNRDFAELAIAVPDTIMVLDHFGTPLGVGPYAAHRKEIFAQWKDDIRKISECDNVVAKLGGLAMPDNGFGWDKHSKPPTSDEFVEAQREWYLHTIDCFGPERCMMESNFPVDRQSISYAVLYNGLKKIVADFSAAEKQQLFYKTAERVYRLNA